MELAVNRAIPGARLTYEDARIWWDAGNDRWQLSAREVGIIHKKAKAEAIIRPLVVDFRISPDRDFELIAIAIERIDGSVTPAPSKSEPTDTAVPTIALPLLADFPTSFEGVTIGAVRVEIVGDPSGGVAVIGKDVGFHRSASSLENDGQANPFDISGQFEIAEMSDISRQDPKIGTVGLSGAVGSSSSNMQLKFERFALDQVGNALPQLSHLKAYGFSIDGKMDAVTRSAPNQDQGRSCPRETEVYVSLSTDQGALRLEGYGDTPPPLSLNRVRADIRLAEERADFTEVVIKTPETVMSLSGSVTLLFGDPVIELEGSIDQLRVDGLKTYWPEDGGGGRLWVVSNLDSGLIKNGKLQVQLAVSDFEKSELPPRAITLDFDFQDLVAHYRRPMPKIDQASGRGELTVDGLDLFITEGTINGLEISGSTVALTDFQKADQFADISLEARGDARALLEVLDSEPLGYISSYGIDPGVVTGTSDAKVSLRFPLIDALGFDEIEFEASVAATNLGGPEVGQDLRLEGGLVTFEIDPNRILARGDIEIGNVPVQIVWREVIDGSANDPTNLHLVGRVSDERLASLGVDLGTALAGEVDFDLSLTGSGVKLKTLSADLNLVDAAVEVPVLGWAKSPGVDGILRSKLRFLEPGQVVIEQARFASPAFRIEGNGSYDPESGFMISIEEAASGANRLSGDGAFMSHRWDITLDGDSFDARPLLAQSPSLSGGGAQGAALVPIHARIRFDQLLLENGVMAENVTGELVQDHLGVRSLVIDGTLPGDSVVSGRFETNEDREGEASLFVDDAGLLVRGLDLYENAYGGVLTMEAETRGLGEALAFEGEMNITDFRIANAPVAAKILALASLSAISDQVQDRGLVFRELVFPFRLENGIIDVDRASANGPGLGFTLSGQVDRKLERSALRGLIVPAYGFNSTIGKVPLLGNVFTGGDKEGLVAFSYQVEGSLNEPEVNVNAATGLLPGIFRRMFVRRHGKLPEPDEGEAKPQANGSGKSDTNEREKKPQ
ncbi:MAG: DUF3971 domain-containing protein [Pseudomonadota bacterium]